MYSEWTETEATWIMVPIQMFKYFVYLYNFCSISWSKIGIFTMFENCHVLIKRCFLKNLSTLQAICQKTTYLSQLPGQISFLVFFCQRKFLPLCKAISNSEKILLENTLNACALIYDGELSFWVCKLS